MRYSRSWSTDSPAAHGEEMVEQVSILRAVDDPRCRRWRCLKEPAAPREPMQEQAPGTILHRSRFVSGTAACGEPMLEQCVPKGQYPTGRTHTGAGEKHEEEGATKTKC